MPYTLKASFCKKSNYLDSDWPVIKKEYLT